MSTGERGTPHTGFTVHGGSVHIGNAAVGTNPIAIGVLRDPPGLIPADDGVLLDADRLRRAVEDLTAAVRASTAQATDQQDHLLTSLREAVVQPRPQRRRALEILGRFADGSAGGEVVFAALGAVLGALGAQ